MKHYGPDDPADTYQPSEAIPPPEQWSPMPPRPDQGAWTYTWLWDATREE